MAGSTQNLNPNPSSETEEPRGAENMSIEVSVIMPCLNEEKTIGKCVTKSMEALAKDGIHGEVLVVDNGSSDKSVMIAKSLGARVVHEARRGYGSAYLKGFNEARGKYMVMADSDGTYDLFAIKAFVEPLRNGYDLVMGSRFKGQILPGAMPWLHRYLGNPVLSGILNFLFRAGISDAHCGMRALTKEAFQSMHLQTTGMEFASEMVIRASKAKLRIAEIPITYFPREGRSKLRSFRDGWRHLRFMLLYSPTYLFLLPGMIFGLIGLVFLIAMLFGSVYVAGRQLGIHSMFLASLLTILGFQITNLGFYAKIYAFTHDFDVPDRITTFLTRYLTLERALIPAFAILLIGLVCNAYILYLSIITGFIALDLARLALFGLTMIVIGVQGIFSAFFYSIMGIGRNR